MTEANSLSRNPVKDLFDAVVRYERECAANGEYMPGIATLLRIYADELADKYPDETNQGVRHE